MAGSIDNRLRLHLYENIQNIDLNRELSFGHTLTRKNDLTHQLRQIDKTH